MDLQLLIKDFLEYLEIEKNVSQLTIRNYAHYLHRFLAFLTDSSTLLSVKTVKSMDDSVLSEAKSRFYEEGKRQKRNFANQN